MSKSPQLIAFEDEELSRFVEQEEKAFSALQWSHESLPLWKFVDKYTLPQIVRIEDGYYSQEEDSSLSAGQILKIHCLKSSKKVAGIDQYGNDVFIPLNAREKVFLRPDNWSHIYETVGDLAQAKPLPRFVEVTCGYYDPSAVKLAGQDQTIEPGEVLEVLREADPHIFQRPTKERFMIFKNQNGLELKLPFDCTPRFKPLLGMKEVVFAEAVHRNKLPMHVSFAQTDTSEDGSEKFLSRFGTIKLIKIYEEALIVASCGHQSVRVVFTIPKLTDVTVKLAQGTLSDDPIYAGLCQDYNNYKKIETLAIKRHEIDIYRTSGEVRGYEYYLKSIEGGEFKGMEGDASPSSPNPDSDSEYVYGDTVLASAVPEKARSHKTLPYEITDIHVKDFRVGGKYSQHLNEKSVERRVSYDSKTKNTGKDQAEPVKLISIKRFGSEDNCGSGKTDDEDSDLLADEMDLETFQLEDANEYLIAVTGRGVGGVTAVAAKPGLSQDSVALETKPTTMTSAPTNGRVTSGFTIPSDLVSLDTDAVCQCLYQLKLGHLEQVFRENQINGDLLTSLDLDDFKDLKLTNFEAKKITKFIKGWRPDPK